MRLGVDGWEDSGYLTFMAKPTTSAAPTADQLNDAVLFGMDWISDKDFTFTGESAAVAGFELATRRVNGATIAVTGRLGQRRFVAA